MTDDPIAQIKTGLEASYGPLDFDQSPILGTYGLVLLARDRRTGKKLAFKTLDLVKNGGTITSEDLAYLQREFHKWLKLPPSRNILSGLMVHSININSRNLRVKGLPVMMMPAMIGSLDDWIGNPNFTYEEKLTASIQLFSGLDDLYAAGIEGHGDLKPSNILYSNLSDKFSLDDHAGWPSQSNPWQIAVADFGWADAWVDIGFTNKALREYMAPERFGGIFIAEKSDIFAAGLIVAQLFQGEHPAKNLKKAKKSEGSWRRCVEQGNWEISNLEKDETLHRLILRCLSNDPNARPSAQKVLEELYRTYEKTFSYPITQHMRHWKLQQTASERIEQLIDVAYRSLNLGEKERRYAAFELIVELNSWYQDDIYALEKWSACATALTSLLAHDDKIVDPKTSEDIRTQAKQTLKTFLNGVTASDIDSLVIRRDWSSLIHPFEWFAEIVGRISDLANIDYETASTQKDFGITGKILLAALAYNSASACRYTNLPKCINVLSEAAELYPNQPVIPYFRYKFASEYLIYDEHLPGEQVSLGLSKSALKRLADDDLARATSLDPDWVGAQG